MPNVRMPDGAVVRFPDDMPREQIRSLIASKFPELEVEVEQPRRARTPVQADVTGNPLADSAKLPGQSLSDMTSGLGQGLTAGFKDELFAGAAAPFRAGYRAIAGGDEGKGVGERLSDAYEIELENQRRLLREAEQRSPIATGIGELAGAVMTPMRGATGAGSLSRAVVRGAGVGAGYGAAYGAGTGEGAEDRFSRAQGGAFMGGTVGAAAPLAIGGAAVLGRTVGAPLVNTIRGIVRPESEAGRRVASAIERDRSLGDGLSPQQFVAGRQAGQPVVNMDAGGETTRALARSAANQSPEARAALKRVIDDRYEGQSERVRQWLHSNTVSTGDAGATREALLNRARAANKPRYARAYADGSKGLWTPELERLSGSPDILAAMKSASTTGKSRSINDGFGAFNPGVQISDTGVVTFTRGRQGVPTYPDLRYWDYVKREMDDAANAARRAGRNEEASRLGEQARLLRDELDRLVPSYQEARAGAARYFKADDALEAGQNFTNMNVDISGARRALARMNQAERALFQEGFVSSLMDKINRTRERTNVVGAIWGAPKAREQIMVALGPAKSKEFEAFMLIEQIMDKARDAMGNSTTARQLVEMGLAGTAGGILSGGDITTGIATALTYGAARKGLGKVDQGVARRVSEMLVSNDPRKLLPAIKAVSNSRNMMQSLRAYIASMAAFGSAQQAAGNAGMESIQ